MEEGCSRSCGFGASNSKAPVDAELWEIWFAALLLPATFNYHNELSPYCSNTKTLSLISNQKSSIIENQFKYMISR